MHEKEYTRINFRRHQFKMSVNEKIMASIKQQQDTDDSNKNKIYNNSNKNNTNSNKPK